ncbi:SLATT domain-containing protein [Mastigocoleus testarum]|nr:SLATT domain-containing protein [Mastigocoleus testarum]
MEWYADRALEMSSCHRNAAGIYGNLHIFFGLPAAILASVSGVSAFAKYSVTAGITAFIVSGLTGAMSFLNPSEKQQLHFEAANALDSWATKTYLLIKRSRASIIEVAEFINRWEGLMQERDQINKQCPLIPSWARSKLLRKFMKPFSYLQQ